MLIEENNDPVYDSEEMKEYMKKWDGQSFLNAMELDLTKAVLEAGVGTGRIAINVVPYCRSFTGIDFSTKTIERAKINLAYENVILICDDFLKYDFTSKYDVVLLISNVHAF
jgi:methylase of polypeptide subunit release factors